MSVGMLIFGSMARGRNELGGGDAEDVGKRECSYEL